MNVRHTASWFCIIVSSLVMAAVAFLVIDNWDNVCQDFHFYIKTFHRVQVGPLMLLSAIGGAGVYLCVRLLIVGVKGVRKAKLAAQQAQQQAAQGQQPQ